MIADLFPIHPRPIHCGSSVRRRRRGSAPERRAKPTPKVDLGETLRAIGHYGGLILRTQEKIPTISCQVDRQDQSCPSGKSFLGEGLFIEVESQQTPSREMRSSSLRPTAPEPRTMM
jgi:hypothetical protein